MTVVNPHHLAADAVAEPDPGAEALGRDYRAGSRPADRLLEPDRAAVEPLEARAFEEDRTVFAALVPVVPADADAFVPRQRLFEEPHLARQRLLDAQDVGPHRFKGRAQRLLPLRPAEALPRLSLLLPPIDLPRHA